MQIENEKAHVPSVRIVVLIILLVIIGTLAFVFRDRILGPRAFEVDERVYDALSSFETNDFDGALGAADALIASADKNDRLAGYLIKASVLVQRASFGFDEEGGAQEAIAAAQEALAIDPNNAEALRVIGYAHEIMEEYASAHEYYDLSLTLDPENPETLTNKGHSYDLQGELEQAQSFYEQALAFDPAYQPALLNMMRMHYRYGDSQSAASIANQLASSSDTNTVMSAHMILGAIALQDYDYEAAKMSFDQAMLANPNNPTLLTNAAEAEFGIRFWTTPEDQMQSLIDAVDPLLLRALAINEHQSRAHLMRYRLYSYVYDVTGDLAHGAIKDESKARTLASVDEDITLTAIEKTALREWFDVEADILLNN